MSYGYSQFPIYNIESNALLNYLINDAYGRGGLTLKWQISHYCRIINATTWLHLGSNSNK